MREHRATPTWDRSNVIVTATDPTGAKDSVTAVITITDVNEKPTIAEDAVDYWWGRKPGLPRLRAPKAATLALVAAGDGAVYTAMDS